MTRGSSKALVDDALELSQVWMNRSSLVERTRASLEGLAPGDVDVVAVGKASREMADATREVLGARIHRRLVISEVSLVGDGPDVLVGEHPTPGAGSRIAALSLLEFLERPTDATTTLFLISGGTSSLCALPVEPLGLDDVGELFSHAVRAGLDITTLNQLRAATSAVAGGGVLRSVRTPVARSLIMVDNVRGGAAWVGSGFTYDYQPTRGEVASALRRAGVGSPLAQRVLEAASRRGEHFASPPTCRAEYRVVADPTMMWDLVASEARSRGYHVLDVREEVEGDVGEVVARLERQLGAVVTSTTPTCLLGVGEVTVRVREGGRGGRCQEFAWRVASVLETLGVSAVAVARSSDGRDYLEGIGGAWVDDTSLVRARRGGFEPDVVTSTSTSFEPLRWLGQLLEGAHTGWNLCDLYMVLVKP